MEVRVVLAVRRSRLVRLGPLPRTVHVPEERGRLAGQQDRPQAQAAGGEGPGEPGLLAAGIRRDQGEAVPEVAAGKWYFEQLFVNGRRAVRALGEAAGAACCSLGIHLDLAPVVDLERPDGMLHRQGRCFSDDPTSLPCRPREPMRE